MTTTQAPSLRFVTNIHGLTGDETVEVRHGATGDGDPGYTVLQVGPINIFAESPAAIAAFAKRLTEALERFNVAQLEADEHPWEPCPTDRPCAHGTPLPEAARS